MSERTTSFAKSVEGLHHEPSALDRAHKLREQFQKAHDHAPEKQQVRETEKPREAAGSQMIRQDAPHLRPAPSGPMRQMVDRQAAYGKLAKERAAQKQAPDRQAQAQKLAQQFKAQQGKPHNHERDHDR